MAEKTLFVIVFFRENRSKLGNEDVNLIKGQPSCLGTSFQEAFNPVALTLRKKVKAVAAVNFNRKSRKVSSTTNLAIYIRDVSVCKKLRSFLPKKREKRGSSPIDRVENSKN